MQNAKTDLFRRSNRSWATRSCWRANIRCRIMCNDHRPHIEAQNVTYTKNERRKKHVRNVVNGRYLLRRFVVGDVRSHAQRPFDVDVVLVQLQQEHNQHKQRVDHEERKHRRIAQFFEFGRDTCLKMLKIECIMGRSNMFTRIIACVPVHPYPDRLDIDTCQSCPSRTATPSWTGSPPRPCAAPGHRSNTDW